MSNDHKHQGPGSLGCCGLGDFSHWHLEGWALRVWAPCGVDSGSPGFMISLRGLSGPRMGLQHSIHPLPANQLQLLPLFLLSHRNLPRVRTWGIFQNFTGKLSWWQVLVCLCCTSIACLPHMVGRLPLAQTPFWFCSLKHFCCRNSLVCDSGFS